MLANSACMLPFVFSWTTRWRERKWSTSTLWTLMCLSLFKPRSMPSTWVMWVFGWVPVLVLHQGPPFPALCNSSTENFRGSQLSVGPWVFVREDYWEDKTTGDPGAGPEIGVFIPLLSLNTFCPLFPQGHFQDAALGDQCCWDHWTEPSWRPK